MTDQELEQLRYPVGHFVCPENISHDQIQSWILDLERLPAQLEKLVATLNDDQLDTPYRPEGWTIRQVLHHIPDSHHHSYIRFKWAMTEDNPLIKAYHEQAWAEQADYKGPIAPSLLHLKAVHAKLVYYLKGLSETDLERTFRHPESKATLTLKENIGVYAWHGKHHYAHIQTLINRKGW